MTSPTPVEVFRAEAAELLERLEATLLDLAERPDDRALVDTAFRALHTLKGSGAMFGFERLAAFTHDLETAFDLLRQGRVATSRDLLDVALAAKDHIRALVDDPDAARPASGQAILARLGHILGSRAGTPDAATPGAGTDGPGTTEPDAPPGWRLGLAFDPALLRNGTNPLALLDELRDLGPCTIVPRLDALPDLDALDPEALRLAWDVVLPAGVAREAIEDVFLFVRDDMTLALDPIEAPRGDAARDPRQAPTHGAPPALPGQPERSPDPDPAPRPAPRRAGEAASLRVEAGRLDELMDRVGELVIAQARLSQIAALHPEPGLAAVAEEIERLSARLRDTTMSIRMVPIASLFGRFRRLVHDLSRELGKPVEFVAEGEDTELDKTMIERLADPLVHLIRNAIDHGIEDPARRAAAGKPALGRIALVAEHAGAQVSVSVRDDGAGLDAGRIRAKAEEKGLVAPGAALSEAQVHGLLFSPGFSTAAEISALSGRGVGMDVVKKTIEGLRGTIALTSEPGAGTGVTLRLPLTLAIIEGLLIRVGAGRYVVPLSAVEECVALPEDGGRDFLDLRGALVPFVRLRRLLGAQGAGEAHQKVIVVAAGGTRVGLVADAILGTHQTVIKSLSKLHADVATFSGATILGDGTAVLILDVGQLVAAGDPAGDAGAGAYREVA